MFTQKELLKMTKVLPWNAGSFKVFVKLNSKLGIKLTNSEIVRDQNYARQESASKVGLGPDVYGTFEIVVNEKTLYGYYTEVVEIYGNKDENIEMFSRSNLDDLKRNLLYETGFDCFDIRPYNAGVKNGRLVCIDFDSEDVLGRSCSDDVEDILKEFQYACL
jgi:hypothetical protein